jgi:hypothetical protein
MCEEKEKNDKLNSLNIQFPSPSCLFPSAHPLNITPIPDPAFSMNQKINPNLITPSDSQSSGLIKTPCSQKESSFSLSSFPSFTSTSSCSSSPSLSSPLTPERNLTCMNMMDLSVVHPGSGSEMYGMMNDNNNNHGCCNNNINNNNNFSNENNNKVDRNDNKRKKNQNAKKEASQVKKIGKPDYTDGSKWETDDHKIMQREKQIKYGMGCTDGDEIIITIYYCCYF